MALGMKAIASPAADMLNGTELVLDGGFSAN
jgi:hypothetical protein